MIRRRALDCGAVEAYVADAREEFAEEYCMPALKANAMYEGLFSVQLKKFHHSLPITS